MKSRPRIITWRDFPQHHRQEKSGLLAVPEPFTISTGIQVTPKGEKEGRRRGRSYSPVSMARPARWLGGSLARAVAIAPTIEVHTFLVLAIQGSLLQIIHAKTFQGVRRPDDESDRVVHRLKQFLDDECFFSLLGGYHLFYTWRKKIRISLKIDFLI